MRVQDLMELQDIVGRKGNVFIIFMNDAQGIPIAGDLLLVARTRCGLIRQQLFQPRIGVQIPSMALDVSALCTLAISTSYSSSCGAYFK